jgi:hypothetical protein
MPQPNRIAEPVADTFAQLHRLLEGGETPETLEKIRALVDVALCTRRGQTLRLGPKLSWIEIGGERVDMRRRHAARRLLGALVDAGAEGIDRDRLILAGWPGERMQEASARMRLHTAIRTLRRLGLATCLQTTECGCRLDPATHVVA